MGVYNYAFITRDERLFQKKCSREDVGILSIKTITDIVKSPVSFLF